MNDVQKLYFGRRTVIYSSRRITGEIVGGFNCAHLELPIKSFNTSTHSLLSYFPPVRLLVVRP